MAEKELVAAIELVLPYLGDGPNMSAYGHFAEDCALVHMDHWEGLAMARAALTDAVSKTTGEAPSDISARLVLAAPCDCSSCIGAEAAEKARADYLVSIRKPTNEKRTSGSALGAKQGQVGLNDTSQDTEDSA
jgi:hypothetical protein